MPRYIKIKRFADKCNLKYDNRAYSARLLAMSSSEHNGIHCNTLVLVSVYEKATYWNLYFQLDFTSNSTNPEKLTVNVLLLLSTPMTWLKDLQQNQSISNDI